MGIPADELAERMTETEFREHFRDLSKEPDVSGKLDIVIAMLGAILDAGIAAASAQIKGGYRPGKLEEKIPAWGRRKRKKGYMDPSIVLATVRSMTKPGLETLSG
jgi:hypothetical protein